MRLLALLFMTVLVGTPMRTGAAPVGEKVFARVSEATGEVFAQEPDGKRRLLKAGEEVGNGARIETGGEGAAQFRLVDESEVRAGPGTRMKLEASEGKTGQVDITLESGKLRGEVRKKLDGRRHFFVKTPSATLGVRGTSFVVSVAHEGAEVVKSEFYCMSGQVQVTDHAGKPLGDLKGGLALRVGARTGSGGVRLMEVRPQVVPIPRAMLRALGNDQFLRSRESGEKFESRIAPRPGNGPRPTPGQSRAQPGNVHGQGPGPAQGQGMNGGPGAGGAMDGSRSQNSNGARPGPRAAGGLMRPKPGPTGIVPPQTMQPVN